MVVLPLHSTNGQTFFPLSLSSFFPKAITFHGIIVPFFMTSRRLLRVINFLWFTFLSSDSYGLTLQREARSAAFGSLMFC